MAETETLTIFLETRSSRDVETKTTTLNNAKVNHTKLATKLWQTFTNYTVTHISEHTIANLTKLQTM